MNLFEFSDYKKFLNEWIRAQPSKGRGEVSRMSSAIRAHQSLLSQVLNGGRDLSPEQAFLLANYLRLTDLESEYFTTAVSLSRAGEHSFRIHLRKKLRLIKENATKVENRFDHDRRLTDEERAIFYSSWIYSAVRLFSSVSKNGKSVEEITEKFDLPRPRTVEIVSFLFSIGLLKKNADRYFLGEQRTFLEKGSPFLVRHHQNWRNKALQYADVIGDEELMFTSPISLSKEDFEKIRTRILEVVKEASQIVKASPAEDVACFNVDLFWIRK